MLFQRPKTSFMPPCLTFSLFLILPFFSRRCHSGNGCRSSVKTLGNGGSLVIVSGQCNYGHSNDASDGMGEGFALPLSFALTATSPFHIETSLICLFRVISTTLCPCMYKLWDAVQGGSGDVLNHVTCSFILKHESRSTRLPFCTRISM